MRRFGKLMLRGLLLRCPACGRPTLVRGILRVHDRCRVCGLAFEHDDGFFLGALILGYLLAFFGGVLPAIILVVTQKWSLTMAMIYGCSMAVLLPIALYWHAKSLWMAVYYLIVPEDLRPGRWEVVARDAPPDRPLTEEEQRQRELAEAIAALEGGRPVIPPGRLQRRSERR
jgi:uncharacterized protein (DUF983 family)